MYELTQVAGNSYYIQSPAKIGLVRLNDTDVCLIDSGNDKEAGRKVRQILDANGWHLTAIDNTCLLYTSWPPSRTSTISSAMRARAARRSSPINACNIKHLKV